MSINIALAGNPNSGKTTLFNALTGANQYVGNWPGVTVEKKEGKIKGKSDARLIDLPGIYSLSPYTLEEVVSRNYLLEEKPDVILNIVDGTNLERNLYLTTQLLELGIPMLVAVNMIDIVKKSGDIIDMQQLSVDLGCPVMAISAAKNIGITEVADAAVALAGGEGLAPQHKFSSGVEAVLDEIEKRLSDEIPAQQRRFYAVKLFERDSKMIEKIPLGKEMETLISKVEKDLDDDAESIITNERYIYITSIIGKSYQRKNRDLMTTSDKVDRIITNRWLALPILRW